MKNRTFNAMFEQVFRKQKAKKAAARAPKRKVIYGQVQNPKEYQVHVRQRGAHSGVKVRSQTGRKIKEAEEAYFTALDEDQT